MLSYPKDGSEISLVDFVLGMGHLSQLAHLYIVSWICHVAILSPMMSLKQGAALPL